MNRVDLLAIEGASSNVKFLEFTRIYSRSKELIICIFEGQDEKYYRPRIDFKLGEESWCGMDSGGREVVLGLSGIISGHPDYSQSRYACFIDHDFQDWYVNENPNRIYVTPCYSIENLYVSESCFRKILSAEFKITEFNENNDEYQICIDLFHKMLNKFNREVYTFNCWVKAIRIMEHKNQVTTKLNLKNIKFKSLVNVDLSDVTIKYDITNPESVFKDSINLKICDVALAEAMSSFDENGLSLQFRGKQQLEFFCCFINKLKMDRTSKSPLVFKRSSNVGLTLSGNCISELSQYADTPECLNRFLDGVSVAA